MAVVLLKAVDTYDRLFNVFRPNIGRQGRTEKLSELLHRYEEVSLEEAKKWWCMQYESSLNTCKHAYWSGVSG